MDLNDCSLRVRFGFPALSLNATWKVRSPLWMRVAGDRYELAFDNMKDRFVKGTTDWKMYAVVLDGAADAKTTLLGAILTGKGHVWADDFKLEIVE